MKICTLCGCSKPTTDFYKRSETKDGLRTDCKVCFSARSKKNWSSKTEVERQTTNKKNRLKHFYNLSVEEYDLKASEQNFKCFICGEKEYYNGKPLYVDHCHTTNKIRKLLCQHCNSGLGMFRDNPELLIKAADYLKEHNV